MRIFIVKDPISKRTVPRDFLPNGITLRHFDDFKDHLKITFLNITKNDLCTEPRRHSVDQFCQIFFEKGLDSMSAQFWCEIPANS